MLGLICEGQLRSPCLWSKGLCWNTTHVIARREKQGGAKDIGPLAVHPLIAKQGLLGGEAKGLGRSSPHRSPAPLVSSDLLGSFTRRIRFDQGLNGGV